MLRDTAHHVGGVWGEIMVQCTLKDRCDMSAKENQIVVYQPNETVRLDVRLENETVWLTAECCQ